MISLSLSRVEDKGRKKEKGKKVHKISIEAKEGNESEANKIDWTRSGVGQREGSHGVSRAWEKASRFIDCKALELPPEALLLLLHHPHCSIKFSSTEELTHGPRWSYVALPLLIAFSSFPRGRPTYISLPFWPIKRDVSSHSSGDSTGYFCAGNR